MVEVTGEPCGFDIEYQRRGGTAGVINLVPDKALNLQIVKVDQSPTNKINYAEWSRDAKDSMKSMGGGATDDTLWRSLAGQGTWTRRR